VTLACVFGQAIKVKLPLQSGIEGSLCGTETTWQVSVVLFFILFFTFRFQSAAGLVLELSSFCCFFL